MAEGNVPATKTGFVGDYLARFVRSSPLARVPVQLRNRVLVGGLFALAVLFPLVHGNDADIDAAANALTYAALALGLNIVVGLAGLLDLGYAAFFAIGAYTYAFADSPFSGNHFPFLPMLFVGAVVAAIFGIILGAPTLRLRGDYLAIMTLGFGEIVPI